MFDAATLGNFFLRLDRGAGVFTEPDVRELMALNYVAKCFWYDRQEAIVR